MGTEEVNARIHALALRQSGVISFKQLLECGLSKAGINRRTGLGTLIRLYPGVYSLPGVAIDWMQRISGAVLWAGEGAAASGQAAAALLGLDGVGIKRPEVVVPYDRNPQHPRIIVHRARVLTAADLLTYRFPPRTNIGRTLVDLSSEVKPRELERALDSAWRRYDQACLWTWQSIHRLGIRGRPEVRVLRTLLHTRLNEPTDSDLEALLLPVIRDSGLPKPFLHYRVPNCPWFNPELDFAWPEHRVGIQADGFTFHSRYRRWLTDTRIRRYLEDLGWQIVVATREEVLERPHELMHSVQLRMGRTFQPGSAVL